MLIKVRWGSMSLMSGCPKRQWKQVDSAIVFMHQTTESLVDRCYKSSNRDSYRTMRETIDKYLYGDAGTRKMWTDHVAGKEQTGRGESTRQNNNVDEG